MTIWLPVENYENEYEISNDGQVRSVARFTPFGRATVFRESKLIKLRQDKDGYFKINLSKHSKKKSFFVHRLVALMFIKNPNNYPVVNHIDGNKTNNDVSNLEWCTISYNTKHAFDIGLREGQCGGTNKKINQISIKDNSIINTFDSVSAAARYLSCSNTAISDCANGRHEFALGFKWSFVE